jgi:hypothetical protein
MKVEDEYTDVLQNIEWAIVSEFRKDGTIVDLDVRDAVGALVRLYEAEAESRGAPNTPLSDRARKVFRAARAACEWRLGRRQELLAVPETPAALSAAHLVLCLKRIRKSIERWNKEGGRQGYLSCVAQYIV